MNSVITINEQNYSYTHASVNIKIAPLKTMLVSKNRTKFKTTYKSAKFLVAKFVANHSNYSKVFDDALGPINSFILSKKH